MEPNAPSQELNHSTAGGPPRRTSEHTTAIDRPFGQSVDSVLEGLETDPERGLSAQEVKRRQHRFGKNLLRQKRARSWLSILADQFRGIIVWLLAVAAAIAFYLRDLPEGIAILVVLVINGAIGFITELRAIRSMEALRRLAQVKALVRRAGETRELDAREIVPGDIVIIEAGDIVGADMRLLQVTNLQCDESALTGESTPVEKQIESLAADTALPDRSNMAFKGTAVARGSGRGVVTATGMATELGRVARLAELAEPEVSPLERRLDQLGHRLVWLTLLLAAVIILAGALRGRDLLGMLETGIALAVAAVPEGLPVVATLCLARGVWRMAARNALVARLSAIETLGSTTIILTDKTGTLTENEMAVARFLLADMDVEVDDSGRGPAFTSDGEAIDAAKHPLLRMALRIGLLCNNAELPADDAAHSDTSGGGDPMELALLSAARLAGLQRADGKSDLPRIKEHAFDPDLKMMATVHRGEGDCFFAVKGAPENVLERCESALTTDGPRPLEAGDREDWVERGRHAARRGYRMLGLAFKSTGDANASPYEGLVLVGLVCLLDPLRDDIPDAIAACRRAGVRVVMLTGDHADTAAEIARQAGLGSGDLNVRQERELERLDRGSADWGRIREADVFARVSPETKLRLASLFQSAGEIVAMTGDGVNDAPALKKADIGIAMGQRGTEVAREAAHVVLKDDAFATIVMAMREGRVIFGNLRKFVVYLLSCNISEILVVSLAVISGLPMPLLPLQILYLNLVTDVFPAFALGLGEGDEQAMTRPPRDPKEPIVDKARWLLIAVLGGAITAATLGAFAIGLYWLRLESDQAITMAFLTIATSQLLNVFNMRAAGAEWLNNEVVKNRYVWGALALCIVLVSLALWLPWLAELMDLPDPRAGGLVIAFAMSVLPLIAGQVFLSWAATRLPSLDRP